MCAHDYVYLYGIEKVYFEYEWPFIRFPFLKRKVKKFYW